MEHFKETDISGFIVGSNGTIVNNTGIRMVKYKQCGHMYVGLELEKNRRVMKKLSNLVYQYHVNRGRPVDEELTVVHIDGDLDNFSADNLSLKARGARRNVDTRYNTNKGVDLETRIRPLAIHPGLMLVRSSSKAG